MKLLLMSLLAASLAYADGRELSGKVVDADTGQPIVRAHVTVRIFQGAQPASELVLLTDTDGTFKVTNMPDSGYQVSCEKPGYLPANGAGNAPARSPNAPATAMTIKMTAQAALEGTVVDDKDMPAADVFVQLVRQRVLNGRRQLEIAQGGGTDETGYFRLYGLPAGRYYLSIRPQMSAAQRAKPVAYPPLYYPMSLDIPTAQPIDLKAGDEQQLKIRLPEPIPAFEIRGVVAAPTQSVSVMLVRQPQGQYMQEPVGINEIDQKTNTFRISHVPPGQYLLQATAQNGKNTLQTSMLVTVGGSDLTGIRLTPADIALDGAMHIDGDNVSPQRGGMGFISAQSDHASNGGQVDAQGKFHIPNLQPGTYRIVPQVYGPQCVTSILQGGRDVRDGLVIAPGVAPDPIDVTVSSHCGSVDVTLSASDSPLPDGLAAYLLHKVGDDMVLEKQGYRSIGNRGDSSVHFTLQGVSPGDYMVYVWPQDIPLEYANAEYMRQFESYGQPVSVTGDGKVSVTIDKILTLPKN